ncbi:MAG TPA: glycosyltransferase [Thermoanaerobaculia bacterium]|nr:glycosyltransferase [Thermoanaerobaculia bacterium]
MPDFSVVVPTFDRLDVLPEVLAALEGQAGAPDFEVIVVDDGSTDGSGEWLAERARTARVPLAVLRQPNRGPAAARNAGVAAARGRRVAFLGDDTVPSTGWLAAHAAAHRRRGDDPRVAVIGYTGWHPRMRLDPFLRHVNEHGLQFGYALIDDPEDVPFNFFYTSNLSLSRELLVAEPFDLSFPYPAWEDIEAGYRLCRRHGLRLAYEPAARTAHDHPTDLARFAARQEKAGYSAVVFHRLHPELGGFLGIGPEGPPPVPRGPAVERRARLVRALHRRPFIEAMAARLLPRRLPRLWEDVLRVDYIRGLHRGWAEIGRGAPATEPAPTEALS